MSDQELAEPREQTFHEFLGILLSTSNLRPTDLHRWISTSERFKAVSESAVKERLRVARCRDNEAHDFPYISHVISFFEANGRPDISQVLRHIVQQQHCDMGLDIFSSDEVMAEKPSTDWLRFPPPPYLSRPAIESNPEFRRWRLYLMEGDYAYYRSSLMMFYRLQSSPCHSFVRQVIAARLAGACITYGDYTDAYIITTRIQQAWERRQSQRKPSLVAQGEDQASSDTYTYLDALQIKAVAVAHIFFSKAITASYQLFGIASDRLSSEYQKGSVCRQEHWRLFLSLHMRILRTYCKQMTSVFADRLGADAAVSPLEGGVDIAEVLGHALHLDVLGERCKRAKDVDDGYYFTVQDTLGRCFYLASLMPNLEETLQSLLSKGLQPCADKDSRRISLFLQALLSTNDCLRDGLIAQGDIAFAKMKIQQRIADFDERADRGIPASRLRESRAIVTEIFGRIAKFPQAGQPADYRALMNCLVEAISPHRMRHNKYSLFTLERFIVKRDSAVNSEEILGTLMNETVVRRSLEELDEEANEHTEAFFLPNIDGSLIAAALQHANRLRKGS